MSCFKCLDLMASGNLKELTEMRNECQMFKNNQCSHLGADNTFSQRIQDSCVRLFPGKIKELVQAIGSVSLLIFMLLTPYLLHGTLTPSPRVNQTYTVVVTETENMINQASEMKASGDLPGAFILLNDYYVNNFDLLTQVDKSLLRTRLLGFGQYAENYKPSELYKVVGAIDYTAAIIARVHGFVTDINIDPLSGTRITISDTLDFTTYSLVVVQPVNVNLSVDVGSEVVLIGVPQFVNVTTPIIVVNWIQP